MAHSLLFNTPNHTGNRSTMTPASVPLPPSVSINSDYNDTQVGALLTSLAGVWKYSLVVHSV